ncbi:MAG: hypothetical protein LBR98_09880 [Syntrophomonadaceae bacterium]|jgi:hypothetical protein|nr:hypothetical protein [Syntrophomonadaceae bacterium]
MAKDNGNKINDEASPGDETIAVPDLAKFWKEIYFSTEEAMGKIVNEMMTSSAYVDSMNQIKDKYLKSYQWNTQNIDKIMESNPLASKKDISGLAELIVGIEDKVDNIDYQITAQIQALAGNLMKLVDFQAQLQSRLAEEMAQVKSSLEQLAQQQLPDKRTVAAEVPDAPPLVKRAASGAKKTEKKPASRAKKSAAEK